MTKQKPVCGKFWRHEMLTTEEGYRRCVRCGTLGTGAPLKVRFWDKVDKNGPIVRPEIGQCWIWKAGRDRGYGRFGIEGKSLLATRVLWEWEVGPLKSDDFLCHKCDNPSCVRLAHLSKADATFNMKDMWEKGRAGPGKITESQVREIRKLSAIGISCKEIAEKMNVGAGVVYNAAAGRTWKWVI